MALFSARRRRTAEAQHGEQTMGLVEQFSSMCQSVLAAVNFMGQSHHVVLVGEPVQVVLVPEEYGGLHRVLAGHSIGLVHDRLVTYPLGKSLVVGPAGQLDQSAAPVLPTVPAGLPPVAHPVGVDSIRNL